MTTYAAIDLGSNSFHLLIAELDQGRLHIRERFSEKIQLGQQVAATGQLNAAAVQRGLHCLADFRDALKRHPAERLRAVGTQALRQAGNSQTFLGEAQKLLGVPVDIISGEEEARLIYLGLACSLPTSPRPRLILDIGGGSTEIAYGHGAQLRFRTSMPMGCVSFRDRFFADGRLTASRYQQAMEAAGDLLHHALADCPEDDAVDYFGSSGTLKSLQRVLAARGESRAGVIERAALAGLRDTVLGCGRTSRLHLNGLREHRRSVLTPGLAILEAAMEETGIDHLVYSPVALREGLIFDMAGQQPA